jgi:hypothetical protein
MCLQESKRKPFPLWLSIPLCILITPFIIALIYSFLPLKNPIECPHCGNKHNEVEYCGLCGKNILGEYHSTWKESKDNFLS